MEVVMKKRGRTSAFIMGLIAGIINILFGLLLIFALIALSIGANALFGYIDFSILIVACTVLILITILNLIGGAVCKSNRVVGGVFMVVTAFLLLIVCIAAIANMSMSYYSDGSEVLFVFLILTQLLSITAAILSFIPVKQPPQSAPYGYDPYTGRPLTEPYQQTYYQQTQTAVSAQPPMQHQAQYPENSDRNE